MKKHTIPIIVIILMFFLFWYIAATAQAITFDWETVDDFHVSGDYRWGTSFDIGYFDDVIYVDLNIKLNGWYDPNRYNYWEAGAESLWNKPGYSVNIDFVTHDFHQNVWVNSGSGHSNMLNWHSVDSYRVAAHEIGHMFGLFDEYYGGAVDPVEMTIDRTGLMGNIYGSMKARYYDPFDNWLSGKIAALPGAVGQPVPEPMTILLMGSGLIAIGLLRKRHGHTKIEVKRSF